MNTLRTTGVTAMRLLWRSLAFAVCALGTVASLVWLRDSSFGWAVSRGLGALALLGISDLLQRPQEVLRNYPTTATRATGWRASAPRSASTCWRPTTRSRRSRAQRSLFYQRAKSEASGKAFGTLGDVQRAGHEFIGHSMQPVAEPDPATFRVSIGGPDCAQPYSASVFNIPASSVGALSANAIRALNRNTSRALAQMLAAAGLDSPVALRPHHLQRRVSATRVQPFSQLQ